MKLKFAGLSALLFSFCLYRPSPPDPEPLTLTYESAISAITEDEFKEHIFFLASDKMKGRNTPSPELIETARYIAKQFKKSGLEAPKEAEDYIQWWEYKGEKVPNCIGILQGSGEKLRHEYIVVGAHMDHVGVQNDEIYNGADDNASGTTAILELAESFAALKTPPRRSIIFMTFAGEELGLLGSRYYVEHPLIPLEKTAAMINLDMIGRSTDKYVFIGGLGTCDKWEPLITALNKQYKFNLETSEGGTAPSDNTSFYRKNIPALFIFTHIHDDYHRPSDDSDKINYEMASLIARFAFELVYQIANSEDKFVFKSSLMPGLPKDFMTKLKNWAEAEKLRRQKSDKEKKDPE